MEILQSTFIFDYSLKIPALSRVACLVCEAGAFKEKKNRPCQEDPALLCRLNYAFFFPFGIFQGSTSSMPSRCILSVWLKVQWRQAEKWGDRVTVRVCSQRIDRLFDRLPRPAQQLMFCRPFYSRCSGDFQNARRIWHFLSTNWTGSQLPRLTCC